LKCCFLERDGTGIVDKHYLADPDGVELLPGAAEALRKLQAAGWKLIIITNQSGIGRGYFTVEDYEAVNRRLCDVLAAYDVVLDDAFYCPHTPEDECACRKPAPAMLLEAARTHSISLEQSAMVGDKDSDAAAGRNAGCRWLIKLAARSDGDEAICVPDLAAAADLLLTHSLAT